MSYQVLSDTVHVAYQVLSDAVHVAYQVLSDTVCTWHTRYSLTWWMGKHWVIFCVNISAFECSFWSTLKNGKSRPWTEPTVWCQPRYRICRGWFYPLLKWFFPLFLCAVMDENEGCVKNIFLNRVQSALKYQFASLRPDGSLGLIAYVFQAFTVTSFQSVFRPLDEIFCLVFHYCQKFRTVDEKLLPFS